MLLNLAYVVIRACYQSGKRSSLYPRTALTMYMLKHMAKNDRKMLSKVREVESVKYPYLILCRLTGPTWKWEKSETRDIPGYLQQVGKYFLPRVRRRTMIVRRRFGRMLLTSHMRNGIQVVFRIPDRSPQ